VRIEDTHSYFAQVNYALNSAYLVRSLELPVFFYYVILSTAKDLLFRCQQIEHKSRFFGRGFCSKPFGESLS
jgi:hypothetical protein